MTRERGYSKRCIERPRLVDAHLSFLIPAALLLTLAAESSLTFARGCDFAARQSSVTFRCKMREWTATAFELLQQSIHGTHGMMYDHAKLVSLSRFIGITGTLGLPADDQAFTEKLVSLVTSL